MCDVLVRAISGLPSGQRRELLAVFAADEAAAAARLPSSTASSAVPSGDEAPGSRTRLVTLGVAGGPVINDPDRAGVATAIVYDDRIYVVDLGVGAMSRLVSLGLQAADDPNRSLARLRGLFFTHLHSDHCVDWPALYATGELMSLHADEPVHVFGPGPRDTLARVFPPQRPAPPVVEPEDPSPGIAGMTRYLRRAFAADFNDRMRDSNFPDPDARYVVADIDHSPWWSVDPDGIPPRLAEPIPVWEDGEVRVTATLVDHHPTAPAYGYRFDTPDGSVVVSGDTTVSENLIDLARGADYLVHEVIDPVWVERVAAMVPPEVAGPLTEHLLGAHTTIEQVGRDVAEPAGVANLVLSHIVPVTTPTERLQRAQDGFSGRLIIGQDLMDLTV